MARNCAIDILNVISSFAWISHFSVQAVDNCAEFGSTEARCGADISALVAAMAMTPAAGYATTSAAWRGLACVCICCFYVVFISVIYSVI